MQTEGEERRYVKMSSRQRRRSIGDPSKERSLVSKRTESMRRRGGRTAEEKKCSVKEVVETAGGESKDNYIQRGIGANAGSKKKEFK